MHSKIIFFVLIMLSFSVVHDTVINTIHVNEHTSFSHYQDENIQLQECDSIDEIHSMFHFEALITAYKNSFIQLQTKQILSHNSLQYTFAYKETSEKPPKA